MFFGNMSVMEARALNPLVLAYVGDAVHSLYVREQLVHNSDAKAHILHVMASKIVRATAQSESALKIMPLLTIDEEEIYKRGRNSKQHSMAKNAKVEEYKRASGLEAVLGFLYLTGNEERIKELLGVENES
ncbi:MAG: ribonuclease III domain-containing protein [Clostridia bacterium]